MIIIKLNKNAHLAVPPFTTRENLLEMASLMIGMSRGLKSAPILLIESPK